MVTTRVNLTTRHYNGRNGETPNLIGIHTMEAPERAQTAENVANYFKTVNASSHWCIDNDSRVRVVNDEDGAWTLPPINNRSLNIEFAGYARQTAEDWADEFSISMLEIGALCVAEWSIKYGIEIRHLSGQEIANKEHGLAGHADVNAVYKKSTHWDPGPNFPWAYFLGRARAQRERLGGAPAIGPVPSIPSPSWNNAGFTTEYMKSIQTLLTLVGYTLDIDGRRGPLTLAAIKHYQQTSGLVVDGLPGPLTLASLRARTTNAQTVSKPVVKPTVRLLQRALRTGVDNSWGPDTDKHGDALRKASRWGGTLFPYGVKFAQAVVGTVQDGSWGPNSRVMHTRTVIGVQRALAAMGFNPGAIDGSWGPKTEAAYQAARSVCRV